MTPPEVGDRQPKDLLGDAVPGGGNGTSKGLEAILQEEGGGGREHGSQGMVWKLLKAEEQAKECRDVA
jgi:hypothetical protein